MAIALKINGRTIPIVRSRAEHDAAKGYSAKMKIESIRSAADSVIGHAVKALRAMDHDADDMAHKNLRDSLHHVIAHSAKARHDAQYYGDSTAAHSVESSGAAAKAYAKAMDHVKAMKCMKCYEPMKALRHALHHAGATMSENAGEDFDVTNDDESTENQNGYAGGFKSLWTPNNLCAMGETVKKIGDKTYGGYLVRFTGPDKTDAEGEYFDKETDFMIGVFPIKGAMSLYNHGLDRSVGSCPIGTVIAAEIKDDGIYVKAEVDFLARYKTYVTPLQAPEKWKAKQVAMASQYDRIIQEMLDDGRLGWSSGAHTPSVVKSKNGHIDRWPIIEASATPIPAMPFETKIQPVKNLIALGQLQNARGVAA